MSDRSTLVEALPRSPEYSTAANEVETGDDLLDQYVEAGGAAVVIDGERWAAFQLTSEETDRVVWLQCDASELGNGHAVPEARRIIAWGSGIEWGSMTSGTFSWSLIEIDDDLVCFIAEPDEDSNTYSVQRRSARADQELAKQLGPTDFGVAGSTGQLRSRLREFPRSGFACSGW